MAKHRRQPTLPEDSQLSLNHSQSFLPVEQADRAKFVPACACVQIVLYVAVGYFLAMAAGYGVMQMGLIWKWEVAMECNGRQCQGVLPVIDNHRRVYLEVSSAVEVSSIEASDSNKTLSVQMTVQLQSTDFIIGRSQVGIIAQTLDREHNVTIVLARPDSQTLTLFLREEWSLGSDSALTQTTISLAMAIVFIIAAITLKLSHQSQEDFVQTKPDHEVNGLVRLKPLQLTHPSIFQLEEAVQQVRTRALKTLTEQATRDSLTGTDSDSLSGSDEEVIVQQ